GPIIGRIIADLHIEIATVRAASNAKITYNIAGGDSNRSGGGSLVVFHHGEVRCRDVVLGQCSMCCMDEPTSEPEQCGDQQSSARWRMFHYFVPLRRGVARGQVYFHSNFRRLVLVFGDY